ncbi:hypothetical protein N7513_003194 [Penicillium frequentans]|nr:hypothetical protein N7513_003194 [Penicillium glabrum]
MLNDLLFSNSLQDLLNTAYSWVAQSERGETIRKSSRQGLKLIQNAKSGWHHIMLAAEDGHLGRVGALLEHATHRLAELVHERDHTRLLDEMLIAAARHGRESIVIRI